MARAGEVVQAAEDFGHEDALFIGFAPNATHEMINFGEAFEGVRMGIGVLDHVGPLLLGDRFDIAQSRQPQGDPVLHRQAFGVAQDVDQQS